MVTGTMGICFSIATRKGPSLNLDNTGSFAVILPLWIDYQALSLVDGLLDFSSERIGSSVLSGRL